MILIIDNYDSFTYNLVNLVAQETADYRVVRNDDMSVAEVMELAPKGVLISPGPGRPEDAGISVEVIRQSQGQYAVLGVCLGHQAIGQAFGAKVIHAPELMHGKTSPVTHDGKSIFEGVENPFTATRYHSLVLDPDTIPKELEVTAQTEPIIMGVRHKRWPIEGIQFHPESVLTTEGPKLIRRWVEQVKARSTADIA
jgi:anthranilate synthase/aminodeoxychorismate synthase-like glutamine amidotransferase